MLWEGVCTRGKVPSPCSFKYVHASASLPCTRMVTQTKRRWAACSKVFASYKCACCFMACSLEHWYRVTAVTCNIKWPVTWLQWIQLEISLNKFAPALFKAVCHKMKEGAMQLVPHVHIVGLLWLGLLQSLQVSDELMFRDDQGELQSHQKRHLSSKDLLGGHLHDIHNVLHRRNGWPNDATPIRLVQQHTAHEVLWVSPVMHQSGDAVWLCTG